MNIVGKVLIVNGHCGASVACRAISRTHIISLDTSSAIQKKKERRKEKMNPSSNDFASRPIEHTPFLE